MDMERIGNRIAALRRREGLSQAALAEKLNVSPQAVSKWERGQSIPDLDALTLLSHLFNISINGILEDEELFSSPSLGRLPAEIQPLSLRADQKRVLREAGRYLPESEIASIARAMQENSIDVQLILSVSSGSRKSEHTLPVSRLSASAMADIGAELSEALSCVTGGIDRGLRKILPLMRCPKCHCPLSAHYEGGQAFLKCSQGHFYPVTDGVADFGVREIRGELWSQYFRNYDSFLQEMDRASHRPDPARQRRAEASVSALRAARPRVILDIACGTCSGVLTWLSEIDWPCTIVLTDISHRVLKYNRQWFMQQRLNPLVDMAFIACDCANLPFIDDGVEAITSFFGFESMQKKAEDGFSEARRVLRAGCPAVHTRCLISGTENSDRWRTCMNDPDFEQFGFYDLLITKDQWVETCRRTGYSHTEVILLRDELPAPEDDVFPYENECAQWMMQTLCISR